MNIEYLAGVVDSDGSIFLVKTKGGYRPYISITMRDRWFLEDIQIWLEMKHNIKSRIRTKKGRPRSAPCYDLIVSRREDCSNFCLVLMSSLIVKYTQCCLMYDFINFNISTAPEEIKYLNRRGVDRTWRTVYDKKETTSEAV